MRISFKDKFASLSSIAAFYSIEIGGAFDLYEDSVDLKDALKVLLFRRCLTKVFLRLVVLLTISLLAAVSFSFPCTSFSFLKYAP